MLAELPELLERFHRPLLQGVALTSFLIAGVVLPRVKDHKLVNPDLLKNMANGLVLFLFSVVAIKEIAAVIQFGLLDIGHLPWALQFLAAFFLLDFSRYWLHFMGHRVPFLWNFHRVHHSAEVLDASTGLRMHIVDFIQLAIIPIVLFQVVFQPLSPWVFEAAMGVGIVFDCFQHSNMYWDMDKPFQRTWHRLLNNPHFHSWHHTRDGHLCDGNYSNTLIIWDRIFGTEVTQETSPDLLGLGGDQRIENTVLGWQLLRPAQDEPKAEPA
jgi:sterol desaturase/sphingolipid hydroxylase (fatty acid hydroxylase superfamily)